MPLPVSMPGVPPGLEYMTQIDQLLVHQLVEVLECEFTFTFPFPGVYGPCVKGANLLT